MVVRELGFSMQKKMAWLGARVLDLRSIINGMQKKYT